MAVKYYNVVVKMKNGTLKKFGCAVGNAHHEHDEDDLKDHYTKDRKGAPDPARFQVHFPGGVEIVSITPASSDRKLTSPITQISEGGPPNLRPILPPVTPIVTPPVTAPEPAVEPQPE